MIRASSLPLTTRPEMWPPVPGELEQPCDWRRSVQTVWSLCPAPGYYYLQFQDTGRAVSVYGRRVVFAGRNAMGRAFKARSASRSTWRNARPRGRGCVSMTHDERRSRPTTCKECGYIRGRHEKDELVTVASVLDAMEEGAGGSRWPRFLFWPSGSVRAGLSWRRWSSAAASFSSASRPQRPRAGAFGYGGGLDAARASTAGGSRAARPVSAWALAGARSPKAASPSPQAWKRRFTTPLQPFGQGIYSRWPTVGYATGSSTASDLNAGPGP